MTNVLSATAGGYTRNSGSFIAEGFIVGQDIVAAGFSNAANNGTSEITAVTATTLTVDKTTPPVPEPGSVTGSFGASDDGFTRTVGSFVTDGFAVDNVITSSGFVQSVNNVSSCTVTDVSDTVLECEEDPQTVDEVEAPARTLTVTNTRSIANSDNRSIAGVLGRIWSFIWDRRPPRPAGI
jgi:hypothetical protein